MWRTLRPQYKNNKAHFIATFQEHVPLSAQCRLGRHTFRVCRTAEDLDDWFDQEKGIPSYLDGKDDPESTQLFKNILGEVGLALSLRKCIEGSLWNIGVMDQAEEEFAAEVYAAVDKFRAALSARGLYPDQKDLLMSVNVPAVSLSTSKRKNQSRAKPASKAKQPPQAKGSSTADRPARAKSSKKRLEQRRL